VAHNVVWRRLEGRRIAPVYERVLRDDNAPQFGDEPMHLVVSVPARRSTPFRSIVVGTQPSVSGIRAYVHDMQPAA